MRPPAAERHRSPTAATGEPLSHAQSFHVRTIRLLYGQLLFQNFEANGECLQVIGAGHSQPLERLLDSLVDNSLERFASCLPLLLYTSPAPPRCAPQDD